jgi:hypothetical protein
MKKLALVIITVISCAFGSFAQTSESEILQSLYGLEKKVLVQEFMELKDDQQAAFWEVYAAYEIERVKIGKLRIALLKKYADSFNTLTDEQADQMFKEGSSIKMKQLKLINKYYKKMKKATSTKLAARFYQIENYLITVITFTIYDSIPFVENK